MAASLKIEASPRPSAWPQAQITGASVKRLGLTQGGTAYAVVKADSVMVGVDQAILLMALGAA